jgi:hypothetical protein
MLPVQFIAGCKASEDDDCILALEVLNQSIVVFVVDLVDG